MFNRKVKKQNRERCERREQIIEMNKAIAKMNELKREVKIIQKELEEKENK